jgi:hypothetical protein
MGADALAAMEYFDRAGGDSHIDFDADEGVRNGIQELVNLDVTVETDACVQPFGELPIGGRQRIEGAALDLLEQLAATDAEFAHGTLVHALDGERDGGVAFGERWFSRPRRQDSDGVMRRHRAIGPVDLGIIERGLVDAALQIVGNVVDIFQSYLALKSVRALRDSWRRWVSKASAGARRRLRLWRTDARPRGALCDAAKPPLPRRDQLQGRGLSGRACGDRR